MNEHEDMFRDIINKLKLIDYINPDDIPGIDLYMDQVTTFMDEKLKSMKRYDDDKMLTKTMINNYTKNNLLPSPEKKKYSKDHMLLLIFIYYFKNVLSISDIQGVINPLTDRFYKNDNPTLTDIYNMIFSMENDQVNMITKDILRKYKKSREAFETLENCDEDDKEFLDNFAFICMLSFDVYIKKTIIEKMIDGNILGTKTKSESKADNKTESKGKPENKSKDD